MAVDIYAPTVEDTLDAEEAALAELINAYRAQNGLPAIPLSQSLTIVAGRHAMDTVENQGGYPRGAPGENKAHGWSDAPYDGRDPATYSSMWDAPERLGTPYPSSGFEISAGANGGHGTMTAERALSLWQGSSGHNAVIIEQQPWQGTEWQALGVGIYEGVAHVWFGADADPAGAPLEGDGTTLPPDGYGAADAPIIVRFDVVSMLEGGPGLDTARLQGPHEAFDVVHTDIVTTITHQDQQRNLVDIERLQFDDRSLAFDVEDGTAGQAYRIYQAAFARTPDDEGLGHWIGRMDDGATLADVAAGFVGSAEFAALYGSDPDDEDFIDLLYHNVLGRKPDQEGYGFWQDRMADGQTRAEVLAEFSESTENREKVADDVEDGIWYVA